MLYVAMNGNDNWSGSLPAPCSNMSDGPLRTIKKARDTVRTMKRDHDCKDGFTISIRQGRYELAKPLILSAVDGGTEKGPVVYTTFPGEKVVISGGAKLDNFQPYNGHILQVQISGFDLPDNRITQLFCDGERMTPARWPNDQGSVYSKDSWAYINEGMDESSSTVFKYKGNRPERWKDISSCQVSIYPNYNWHHIVADVSSIHPETKEITLKNKLPYNLMPGRRLFFQNIFEELDQPKEWYYNGKKRVIYFYPPEKMKSKAIIVPRLDNLMIIDNCSHVYFKGFTLEVCNSDAVKISGGKKILIAECTIRNTGGYGVVISGGSGHGVVSSTIFDTGKGAIILSGGDRKRLIPAGHHAENNHIYKYGQICKAFHHAVTIKGVGNRLRHNNIHDGPDIAVRIYGNEHIVEYNEIYDVCQELADTGAIYIGRDWTSRGNIIRFNKIHDVYGFGISGLNPDGGYRYETPLQTWGIYLDDCASGMYIYGNVIYRIPLGGVRISGGNDNIIENNVFIDCIPAVSIAASPKDLFIKNEPGLQEKLSEMMGPGSIYGNRYPELLSLHDRDRRIPMNNRFVRNIVEYTSDDYAGISSMEPRTGSAVAYEFREVDIMTTVSEGNTFWHKGKPVRFKYSSYERGSAGIMSWNDIRGKGLEKGSSILDPCFVNQEADDIKISEDSPIYKIGFHAIPFKEIGVALKNSGIIHGENRKTQARFMRQVQVVK